jgi:LysR family transcriptional regulator, regulator of abg operon
VQVLLELQRAIIGKAPGPEKMLVRMARYHFVITKGVFDMKITALKALVAAIEEGSLRSAARRLGTSQPALTKLVRELEIELAAPLLERHSKGVVATPQGLVLFEHGQKALCELAAAADWIQQMSGRMQGQLTVAAVPVAMMLLIPETLRTFSRAFPDIELRISEQMFVEQLEKLRNGEADVVVGGIPPGLPAGEFITESLMQTRMVVVARKGSRHARAKNLAELAQESWIYTGHSQQTGYAARLFELHGMPAPPAGAVVNSTLALMALLGSADLLGLMPEQIVGHPLGNNLVRVALEEPGLPLTVGVMSRSSSGVSPAVRQFIAHLHRAAHQLTRAGPSIKATGT